MIQDYLLILADETNRFSSSEIYYVNLTLLRTIKMLILNIFFLFFLPLSSSYEYVCGQNWKQDWRRHEKIYLSEREVLTPTQHGFSMIVDATDAAVSKRILDGGSWEQKVLTLIAAIVKPGYSLVNLGTQTGLEAIMMGKLAGPTGKLLAFEPFSISYKMVVKNLQINGLSDIS